MTCKRCKFYTPYDVYPFIGLCARKNSITFHDCDPCEEFEIRNIDEILKQQGRVYCLTCKTWVYPWNFDEHKEHDIFSNVIEDELIFEESYAAD